MVRFALAMFCIAAGATALQQRVLSPRPTPALARCPRRPSTPSEDAATEARNFCEDAAQKSADAVRKMSIEERTRRAMAAEAAEDEASWVRNYQTKQKQLQLFSDSDSLSAGPHHT